MSEVCEICGREKANCNVHPPSFLCDLAWSASRAEHFYTGYERTLARADRYEAEFSACKALLIAAQQRAERAEAERAAAEARAKEAEEAHRALREIWGQSCDHERTILAQRDEARAALAALPVEPARRQVTENANALGAPAAGCSEENT
jgi:hypothetical protein